MGRTSARATKALADESVIIDDTQSHEASMRVTFEGGASTAGSRPTTTASAIAPLADCIDVSIGVTNVTRWKVTDYLRPPGLGLKNSGLDPKLADSVYSAACRGDAEAISKLLGGGEKAGEEGADPKLAAAEDAEPAENTPEPGWKIVDAYGVEPLAHAASAGHADACTALLDCGANIEATCPSMRTALYRAAKAGHAGVIEVLVEKGAFVDAEADDGATPLQAAVLAGNLEAVRAHATDQTQCTPCHPCRSHTHLVSLSLPAGPSAADWWRRARAPRPCRHDSSDGRRTGR